MIAHPCQFFPLKFCLQYNVISHVTSFAITRLKKKKKENETKQKIKYEATAEVTSPLGGGGGGLPVAAFSAVVR